MVDIIQIREAATVIFVNGPPRCGKDTVGQILATCAPGRRLIQKFAMEVKERTHAAFRIVDETGRPVPHDFFEDRKDYPLEEFLGISPRQAYIEFSERFYKPIFGQDIFGRLLAKRLKLTLEYAEKTKGFRHTPTSFTITDCGFVAEVEPIVRMFDPENCTLIRVHRAGCDFSNDSRSYVNLDHLGVRTVEVPNPGGTIAAFQTELELAIPSLFIEMN